MKKIIVVIVCLFLFILINAWSTQNGQLIDNPVKYLGGSQKNYFVTPTGTGDCLSWDTACTFRSAVSKLSSSYTTTIYLSGGVHDCNNGSDATGTTISTQYVRIFGMNNAFGNPITRLVNSRAAGATHVLRITGANNSINNVAFGNYDQTDKNVIMLNIQASDNDVQRCTFRNAAGDGGGTGILIDNSAANVYLTDNQFFNVIDSGLEIGQATDIILARTQFYSGGKGIYISNANATRVTLQYTEFVNLTTGIDYAAAANKVFYFMNTQFANNVTNVAAVAAYGTTWLENIIESGRHANTYPTTNGVQCDTGDGAWVWTASPTTVIPEETLTKPFKLTAIHFQNWNAEQTFKFEILYGKDSANNSLGIYEVTLGDPAVKSKVDSPIPLDIYIPAYAMVGIKAMSSTAGVDYAVITLGYEEL